MTPFRIKLKTTRHDVVVTHSTTRQQDGLEAITKPPPLLSGGDGRHNESDCNTRLPITRVEMYNLNDGDDDSSAELSSGVS